MDAEKALAALTAFKSGGITERLSEYATNPDDPLHADIQELLTAFFVATTLPPCGHEAEIARLRAALEEIAGDEFTYPVGGPAQTMADIASIALRGTLALRAAIVEPQP